MQSKRNAGLEDFIPLLIQCRACAVFKSRVAASLSLAGVVTWDKRIEILNHCCQNVKEDVCIAFGVKNDDVHVRSSPHNRIHGGLLQASYNICKSYSKVRVAGNVSN